MLQKLWEIKLTRFLAVGVFNTLFDLLILNLLVFGVHMNYVVANLISASISISTSYFLNYHIVFRSKEGHTLRRFVHFFAVTGIGILVIQTVVIYSVGHLLSHEQNLTASLLNSLGFSEVSITVLDLNIAKFAAVAVAMCWNLLMYHFVVFRQSGPKPNTSSDLD